MYSDYQPDSAAYISYFQYNRPILLRFNYMCTLQVLKSQGIPYTSLGNSQNGFYPMTWHDLFFHDVIRHRDIVLLRVCLPTFEVIVLHIKKTLKTVEEYVAHIIW